MVLKKRTSGSVDEEEPKKRRKEDKAEESPENKKKEKKSKEYVVKVKEDRLSDDEELEEEEENLPEELEKEDTADTLPWPQPDMMELFSRIEASIPSNDTLSFSTRAERLDWDVVAFNEYSPAECKNVWTHVQKKLRKFRMLKELVADARQWVRKPWTTGGKQKPHPDMPRRPLTSFMVYYMEKKDKVAAQNPDLDMTSLSKVVSGMYRAMPDHKKEKYVQKAVELKEEYIEKLNAFYEKHPECKEVKRPKDSKFQSLTPGGPKKPRTPLQIFLDDRLSKLKDSKGGRAEALEQWKHLSDKKRLVWINWALEEETKYQESVKLYVAENPDFQPPPFKSVLKKDEMLLRDRAAGKPSKPPNSAYSLYSRIMLSNCPSLRKLVPKERMKEISLRWQEMSDADKAEYDKKVKHEQAQYKLDYAAYLDSLPEEERQEELMRNQVKKKKVKVVEEKEVINNGNNVNKSKTKKSRKSPETVVKKVERLYFPGEPRQPPVNAYDLFLDSFLNDTKLSAKEAPQFWEMLPSSDKEKFHRKLKELKEKYIKDYEKFVSSLDEKQLAKYNDLQKRIKEAAKSQKQQHSDNEEDSSSEDETRATTNNAGNDNEDSDSDEDEEKKSDSSSDSSSSSSENSSSSSSSDDSDSSSDDSDDEDKKTNQKSTKNENSDSDSSDDD